jgi:superfamily II DNA or RNA helicase
VIPTLRDYQIELTNRVRAQVARGKRIIVAQATTGAGKTVWAADLARQAYQKGKFVLFLVHRRRLVNQISSTLVDFQVPHGILMRGERASVESVQVASRDTLLSRCVRNQWVGMPGADVVIVDEAHHAADPQGEYRRILAQYPRAVIILLSATPVGPDGRGLGPWAQAIECAAPTAELIRQGYLVPVKCYAPERRRKGKKFLRGIAGDLVESWKQYAEGRPTVLFCSRVQHSLDAVAAFQAQGITAAHIDADTPDAERDRIFAEVAAGRITVLANVGIVGEGVDVPELGCCQLFCEVNGRVKFLQACGRIMRPSPGKSYGILIDHSGAVFRHGFPDEDTAWTLEGNVDAEFKARHDRGETERAFYCKHCELAYHGTEFCPQCGRKPVKPPKSIFAPDPVRPANELLVEAQRGGDRAVYECEERVKHWMRCLATAKAKNGTFGMAAQIYKRKYNAWPDDDFPCMPERWQWQAKVADVYPDFGRRRAVSGPRGGEHER